MKRKSPKPKSTHFTNTKFSHKILKRRFYLMPLKTEECWQCPYVTSLIFFPRKISRKTFSRLYPSWGMVRKYTCVTSSHIFHWWGLWLFFGDRCLLFIRSYHFCFQSISGLSWSSSVLSCSDGDSDATFPVLVSKLSCWYSTCQESAWLIMTFATVLLCRLTQGLPEQASGHLSHFRFFFF